MGGILATPTPSPTPTPTPTPTGTAGPELTQGDVDCSGGVAIGDAMGAPASQQLTTGTVAPGQSIDVSVNLTAPGAVVPVAAVGAGHRGDEREHGQHPGQREDREQGIHVGTSMASVVCRGPYRAR